MKFINEYRDVAAIEKLLREINRAVTRPWTIMEVCGGQTHAILRFGIDQALPDKINLVHGPGCPVCVTSQETVDKALALASKPEIIFCTFGDMLRVPGTQKDLFTIRAEGGDIRTVYTPLDALQIARENPDREVVFFAVGFETTAPTSAATVLQAQQTGITNFSLLSAHVRVIPAMTAILEQPDNRIQGFLAAGHVCTVTGFEEYQAMIDRYKVPVVVTGFEPVDLLSGILACVELLEKGEARVVNRYPRVVKPEGNLKAQEIINRVYEVVDRNWRGLGNIKDSGLALKEEFAAFDADKKFKFENLPVIEDTICRSGEVLTGVIKPDECAAFGKTCTPEHPLGATMVSSEGACAAYFKYHRHDVKRMM